MRPGRQQGDGTGSRELNLMGDRSKLFLRLVMVTCALFVFSLVGGCSSTTSTPTTISADAASHASSGTPTPGPLPQTATASGLRITLVSAKRNGSQLVLTFKIESANPKQPNMWAVGGGAELMGILPPENDIEATGLRWDNQAVQGITPVGPPGAVPPLPAPSPTPQPTPNITGYQETLPFVLTGPANQPVTVTVRRVRFEHGPSAPPPGKVISGTWSFAFVPANLGPQLVPTPHRDGSYYDLSLSQAEQLVGFPIALPNPLPDVLQPLPGSSFIASAVGSTGSANANYVTFSYSAADMIDKGVTIIETSADSAMPTIQQNTIHWIDRGYKKTTPVSQVSTSTLTIKGVAVTRWDTTQQDAHVIYYLWDKGGVHFIVSTVLGQQVTEAVMEQFVGAMIAPSGATPQPSPTPTLPLALPTPDKYGQIILAFAQVQRLATFYVARSQWVPPYLADQGVMVPQWQGAEPPGSPFERIILAYGSSNPSQHYMVQISESSVGVHSSFGSQASTPTTVTIAGHRVTRTDITARSGAQVKKVADYLWQDQGTTFELAGDLSGPVTEQDLEHMVASMIGE